MRAARLALIAAAAPALALAACSSHDVVLATLSSGDAQAATAGCSSSSDCDAGSYCDKTGCGAATGTCQPVPATCDPRPVCGCDGITYFDDCLRIAQGVSVSTPGPCSFAGNAVPCGGPSSTSCPQGAVCGIIFGPGPCPPQAEGSCWVLPAHCPPVAADAGHVEHWDSCQPGGPRCQDLCAALRSGVAYRRSSMCF